MTHKDTVILSSSNEYSTRFGGYIDMFILTDNNGKTVDCDTDEIALRQRNRNKYIIREI